MIDVHEAALSAALAGLSVLPPKQNGTKAPDAIGWTKYQKKAATEEQINAWYAKGRTGLGYVTGKVSGNLEVIDFDDRGALVEFENLCNEAGVGALLDLIKEGYFEHSPNGAHLFYRCDTIAGNTKLAKKGKKATIETRGEGGYIVAAPTYGSVNAAGAYVIESGGVDTITTIEPADRDTLHDIARTLDESITPADTSKPTTEKGGRPGDAYNDAAGWSEILEPHGWVKVSSRLGVVSWRRPGKEIGISATTNHAGSDLLYVFSSSTGFETERGYSKFSAYALLDHGSDFKEASRQLALLGFGQQLEAPDRAVDISGIMSRWDPPKETRQSLEELLRVPGLVGELAEWINESSIKPQPVLALGASIAAMATVLGRKVQTKTGLHSNVYILGVGETGCGKERARQAIKKLFAEVGTDKQIGESFASDSAVETAVIDNPACLYLIDELGHFLGTVKNDQTPSYVKAILPILLRMYSASEGTYVRRTFAKADEDQKQSVEQPCLSIYGTTVPSNLYKSISKEHASDGFLSRLLVFESGDPDPFIKLPDGDARKVPQSLIDGFKKWADASINPYDVGNLSDTDDATPEPLTVGATSRAWEVFDRLEASMRAKRTKVRVGGGDQGPYTRVWATAQKLAMIRACGVRTDAPEITESDAQWGADLAWILTDRFLSRVGETVAENRTEDTVNRIGAIIEGAGSQGASKSAITRAARWASRRDRDDALVTLLEGGQVAVDKLTTGGKTRTVYRWR